jgi:hypothetical protein
VQAAEAGQPEQARPWSVLPADHHAFRAYLRVNSGSGHAVSS